MTFTAEDSGATRIDNAPLSLRAGYLLRRSNRVHGQLWSSTVKGLTSPQFGVLSAVERCPGIDQRTLGEAVSLDRASIAGIVSRLIEQGRIHRTRDPSDARRKRLMIDSGVQHMLAQYRGLAAKIWNQMFDPVPRAERELFIGQLQTIAGFSPSEPDAGALFRRLEQKRTATWSRIMGPTFTGAQYAVIHVIGQRPGLTQTEVGDIAAVDKATAAALIERLEERGWLRREADPRDGRVRRLTLTKHGLDAVTELTPRLDEVQRLLLEPTPRDDIPGVLLNWTRVAYRGRIPSDAL